MIRERVRAGFKRARGEGKRLERPPPSRRSLKRESVRLWASLSGPGVRKIAERFCVNPSTVQRISRPQEGLALHVNRRALRAVPRRRDHRAAEWKSNRHRFRRPRSKNTYMFEAPVTPQNGARKQTNPSDCCIAHICES